MKKIMLSNWLKPDPVHSAWKKDDPATKQEYSLSEEGWVLPFLNVNLSESVPAEISTLFEVARGAMIYGFFFYPLWSLGYEQLTRVGEAAINHKATALDASRSKCGFFKNINWLVDKSVISESSIKDWNSIRELRNWASHQKQQNLFTPAVALAALERLATEMNMLFRK